MKISDIVHARQEEGSNCRIMNTMMASSGHVSSSSSSSRHGTDQDLDNASWDEDMGTDDQLMAYR